MNIQSEEHAFLLKENKQLAYIKCNQLYYKKKYQNNYFGILKGLIILHKNDLK